MIGIKQSPSCLAADSGKRKRCLWPALSWLALLSAGACGDSSKKQATEASQTTLVRPATSVPAKAEEPPREGEGEGEQAPPAPAEAADIPRGVSAPELSPEEAHAQEQVQPAADVEPSEPSEPPTRAGKAPRSGRTQSAQAPKSAPAAKAVKAPAEPKPASAAKAVKPPAPPKASRLAPAKQEIATANAKRPRPTPAPAAPVVAPPAPVAPQPVAAAKRVTVQVPSTEHVRVDVPAGLQGWLDADDRMRPWLGKAIAVADSCYAKVRADNANAAGEIAVQVTMHENARPSGRVSSVAPALSDMTMCATTRLLGVKMPLFTGREGETYVVRVRFSP